MIRDIVWKFGTKGDLPVTGDWNGDGYDEIGVLGKRGGKDFFFLDLDRNGAFDPAVDASFEFKMQGAGNGEPIAGDWDGDGSDEVAALKGNSWFIDDTGAAYSPALALINSTRISTSMRGLPIAAAGMVKLYFTYNRPSPRTPLVESRGLRRRRHRWQYLIDPHAPRPARRNPPGRYRFYPCGVSV